MDKVYGFYIHYRADGMPFYVGKGTEKRAKNFYRSRNAWHTNIRHKDGTKNLSYLFTPCSSEQQALEKEVALIALYRAIGLKIINHTDGGEGTSGFKLPDSAKAKIGAAIKQAWQRPESREALLAALNDPVRKAKCSAIGKKRKGVKLSPEHCAKISAAVKKRTPRRGYKMSAETRAKMSESKKELYKNPELRKQMSLSRTGKKHSPETRQKIGAAHKALWENPEYKEEHKLSEETKAKIGSKSKALWATSEYRNKISKALTGKVKSPEARAKQSASLKATLSTPEAKERRRNSANFCEANRKKAVAFWSSPQAHDEVKSRLKKLWATPEYRERVLAARKKAKEQRDSKLID